MKTGRLEAFSDGVLAIIITIMVLELKVPHGAALVDIMPLLPVFLSYVLSFVYVGIYWNNHHHMLYAASKVSGAVLWANLHLLFWLSLLPFATGWMGENHFAALPTAAYGTVLLFSAVAYWILQQRIIAAEGASSQLRAAVGSDWKGKASPVLYLVAIGLAFWLPQAAQLIYVIVALMWFVPDRRIEDTLAHRGT
jgi:uncharacterized membrane protein